MPAVITATGTWSDITDLPVEHAEGNVTTEYETDSLAYGDNLAAATNGYQEVQQFVALFAANYGLTFGGALSRVRDIIISFRSQPEPAYIRTYP